MSWLFANPYNITAQQIGVPTSTGTVSGALANVVQLLMGLLGGLALIFIVVGGLQLSLSAGNPAKVSRARETILYASVGLVVAIGAYAIVSFLAAAPTGAH